MTSKQINPPRRFGWALCLFIGFNMGCWNGVDMEEVLGNSVYPIPQTSVSPNHYSVIFDPKVNDYVCISYTDDQTLPLDLKLDPKVHRFFQSYDVLITFNSSTKEVMIFNQNLLKKTITISENSNPWHLTWFEDVLITQEVIPSDQSENGYLLVVKQYTAAGSPAKTEKVPFESQKKTGMYRVLLSFLSNSRLHTFIPLTEELVVFDKSLKRVERKRLWLPERVKLQEGRIEKRLRELEKDGHLEILDQDFNGINIKVIPVGAFTVNNIIKLSFLTVSVHGYDYSESRMRIQTKTDLVWLDSQLEIAYIEEIPQWHILGLHGEAYLGRKENPNTPQRPIFSLITPRAQEAQNP